MADKKLTAALFDVDGTLVDTNYLHTVTWWQAFAQAGHVVAMTDIHHSIGMGSGQMMDRLLPAERDRNADADLRTSHSALYATYWSRLRPLPQAADLLRACHGRGLAVVLVVLAVIGPLRDQWFMRRFPEWGSYGPGIAPVLAISASYVVLVLVGHGVMRLVAGPAREDRLARRPWESS